MKYNHTLEFELAQYPHRETIVHVIFEADPTEERYSNIFKGFYNITSERPLSNGDLEVLEEYVMSDRREWE